MSGSGEINSDHDADLRYSILHDPIDATVLIQFSGAVNWLSLSSAEARKFAEALLDRADRLVEEAKSSTDNSGRKL